MDFINKMKKREFIEMGLKTLAAVLAGFLAIILMEGMIYSIKLNALKTKSSSEMKNNQQTIAYCIKEAEDKYFVIHYNPDQTENGASSDWSAIANTYKTKAQCEALAGTVKEIKYGAPNAFIFSITGTHYIVMAVFMAGIVGFFTYKFIALAKSYKKIEDEYNKTGTISMTNS